MVNENPPTRGAVDILAVRHGFLSHSRPLAVLEDVSLSVPPGQFVSLVGPSGCGKSTLLRLVAGLDHPVAGSIYLDGREVTGPGPGCGFVFQDPTLLPWLSVERNVALGPRIAKVDQDPAWRSRVDEMIEVVGLGEFREALPAQLSGGMAQRASLARALVTRPDVLLLDEPLGKLDALTRASLQQQIGRLWAAQGFTALMVTHDVEEALLLSDRVVVLSQRPAAVVADVAVDLPRPRRTEDPELVDLRSRILGLLA